MRSETKYVAIDGQKFSTTDECQLHEQEYRHRQEQQWDYRMKLYLILKDEYREKKEKCPHCVNGRIKNSWGYSLEESEVDCPKCHGLAYKILPESYPNNLITHPPEIPEDLRLTMKAAWDKYWADKKALSENSNKSII